jgi:iron complex outermembrane receptor protein
LLAVPVAAAEQTSTREATVAAKPQKRGGNTAGTQAQTPADDGEAVQQVKTLDPIMVTAPLIRSEVPLVDPVNELTGDDLRVKVQGNLGKTIQQEMGVNSASFGAGVGQPVIRGQTGPRVRVMQDQTGAADAAYVSPDHRNTVETLLADKIEIMRGPATMMYGGTAIGGAVNVIDNRVPSALPKNMFASAFEQRYDSALKETATVGKVDVGQGLLAAHFDGYFRNSGNQQIPGRPIDVVAATQQGYLNPNEPFFNPIGYVPNSQAQSYGGTAGFSLVGDPGFAGFAVNYMENTYGIPGTGQGHGEHEHGGEEDPGAESGAELLAADEHDHDHDLTAPVSVDPFVPIGFASDTVKIRQRQTRYDFKSEWYDPVEFAEMLKLRMTYTDYYHVELENDVAGTTWTNQGWEGRAELKHRPLGPMQGVLGFQGISSVFEAVGEEAVVPKSDIQNFGGFAVETLDFHPFSLQGGFRVEHQTIVPVGGLVSSSHTPVSGSASASWQANEANVLAVALTRAQRAPQVQELYSDGFHAATRAFEIGDPNLQEETNYNLELSYRLNMEAVRANLNLFQNWAEDYIYAQNTGQVVDPDTESFVDSCPSTEVCSPVYQFSQADASFIGYEADVGVPVADDKWGKLDLILFSDYVRGQFVRGGNVPRQPPLRYGFQFDYRIGDFYANWRVMRAEAQDNPAENEPPTPGYVLMNINLEYKLSASPYADVLLFARGNNLLDQSIRNATSFLRSIAPEPGIGGEIGVRATF